jgi:hypothetical protein
MFGFPFRANGKRETMDAPRTVPAVSAAQTDSGGGGLPGIPAHNLTGLNGGEPIGVDVPGVGNVRNFAYAPATARATRPHVAGEVPQPLLTELQNGALIRLIFDARRLAESRIVAISMHEVACLSCSSSGPLRHGVLRHDSECPAGRVLAALAEMGGGEKTVASLAEPASAAERDGLAEEDAGAGDFGEPWRYNVDDALGHTSIYDREGTFICRIDKADREATEWAGRITDCVNAMAPTAVSK